jgi:cytidylate kinase
MIKLANLLKEVQIEEGVYDPGILKAFFMAGGPGSGKSFVADEIFGFPKKAISSVSYATGLKLVNNDPAFEKALKDAGYSPSLLAKYAKSPEMYAKMMVIRDKAKGITKKMQKNYLIGRLGQVIDGTGKDYDKMKNYKELYDNMGYDSYMVFVNTSLEVALERNQKRERKLDDTMVKNMWQEVQDNLGKFQKLFGVSNMLIIDNSEFGGDLLKDVEVEINKRLKSPIKNPLGRKWMEMQLKAKKMNEAAGDGYKVYCDMDGVLADFVDQWKEYHKQDPSAHKKKIGKKEFDVFLDGAPLEFWTDMKFMPDARGGKALWDKIKNYDTEILSSPAESEASRKGKQTWLKSKGINIPLNLKKSYKKQEFAAPNHILIDDYKRNIDQWEAAGGIGILHKDNATTFAELKKYGIV